MKGISQNLLSAMWKPKIVSVQISEKTAPKPPLENNSEKKNVCSKVTIPAGATRCFDVDVNIGTEVKILHDRQKMKLFGCCLLICVYSAVMYGLIAFQLDSKLTITNQRFIKLQQEMRWMASNYRQMKQKMLSMRLSLDQLLNKYSFDESLNSEESPSSTQFVGTDGEPLSQSVPHVLSYSEINSNISERMHSTKSSKDNANVVSETDNQLGLMSSHNLTLREYDEVSNSHLKNNKSVSVSDNVTSFQNVFSQSEVPFVDNINSLDTFIDYESASIEDFHQEEEGSAEQPSRVKRSNRRGKQSGVKSSNKAGNRHHKKPKMRGPVAAHFKGGQIETVIRDGGLIAPWYPDEEATGDFGFSAYQFREGMGAVEVTENGLYLLYAQAYYLTTESLNSFSINIMPVGEPDTPVAFCSTSLSLMSTGSVTEASCFTSVVRYLNATTRVTLKQRERNRRMILREGYTFLGLVKLNSQQPNKGRRGN